MSGFLGLVIMSIVLGAGCFAVGMLPLSFAFSRLALTRLTTFGNGLLLGTALGVIVPEGVEVIAMTNGLAKFPSTTVAFSLVGGFSFMLVVERLIARFSPHSHDYSHHVPLPTSSSAEAHAPKAPSASEGHVEFDAELELDELERAEGIAVDGTRTTSRQVQMDGQSDGKEQAYALTLGLMVHALADGFALGTAATSPVSSGLSFVIFLALVVHKAPVALALTTSLLSTTLSRAECRKHLAVFSASTPIGALAIYGIMSLVRIKSESSWTGIVFLISGGTFLYVATVIQPGKGGSDDISERTRLVLVLLGILVPVLINTLFGHDH